MKPATSKSPPESISAATVRNRHAIPGDRRCSISGPHPETLFRESKKCAARRAIQRFLGVAALICAGCGRPSGNEAGTAALPPRGNKAGTAALPPGEISDITAAIASNAARIDRPLWASSASVTARMKDEHGKKHAYNLEGSLLFDKPRSFRMDLRPGLGEQVMGLGSNDEEYWIWIEPEVRMMRWGRHRFADQPCARSTGIRVDQLVASLGLGGLPTGSEGLQGPAGRRGKKHEILEYSRTSSGGGNLIDREYWVDRAPPFLIRVVNFQDAQGRVTMSAYLDDYKPAWTDGPMVPHSVSMIWPLDDSKFTMRISRLKGMENGKVAPTAFVRPTRATLPKGVTDIIQVDADCDKSP